MKADQEPLGGGWMHTAITFFFFLIRAIFKHTGYMRLGCILSILEDF